MNSVRLLKESTLYLIGTLLRRGLGIILIPLYTNLLTPAEFGTIELIELTILVVSIGIGLQALGSALVRIYHDAPNSGEQPEVVSTALIGMVALGIVVAGVGSLFAPNISRALFHGDAGATRLVQGSLVALVLSSVSEVALSYLRLRGKVGWFVAYSAGLTFVQLALNVYFIAFVRMGVAGYVVSKLIAVGGGTIVLMWVVIRETGFRWNNSVARRMFSFGSPLVVTGLCSLAVHYADRYFLDATVAGLTAVGIYSLAYKFPFLITDLIGEPFSRTWNVRMYEYAADPNWEQHVARIADPLAFLLVGSGVVLSAVSGPAIKLVAGPAYQAAATVVPILVFAYVLREFGDFFSKLLYINKRSVAISRIAIATAIVNTVLNYVLIRRMGIMGAALATFAAWFVHLVLSWKTAQKEYSLNYPAKRFTILAAGGMLACAAPIFNLDARWDLLVKVVLVSAFFAAVWMTGFLRDTDAPMLMNRVTEYCRSFTRRTVAVKD